MPRSDEWRVRVLETESRAPLSFIDESSKSPPAHPPLPETMSLAAIEVRISISSNQITRNTHEQGL